MRAKEEQPVKDNGIWKIIGEFFETELTYIKETQKIADWYSEINNPKEEKSTKSSKKSESASLEEYIQPYLNEGLVSSELTKHPDLAKIFERISKIKEKYPLMAPYNLRDKIKDKIKKDLEGNTHSAFELITYILHKRIIKRDLVYSNLMIVHPAVAKFVDADTKGSLITPIQRYPRYRLFMKEIVNKNSDMTNPYLEASNFIERCNDLTELSDKVNDVEQKLACLTLVSWDTDKFFSSFETTLEEAILELNESQNSDFCQVPRIEPYVQQLLLILNAIKTTKGDLGDVVEASKLAVDDIVRNSGVKTLHEGSPQAKIIQIIRNHQLQASQYLTRKEFMLGALRPLETYFTQPGHAFSDLKGKKKAYTKLLKNLDQILGSDHPTAMKIKLIKANIEATEKQYSFLLIGYAVGVFVPLLKEFRTNLNENHLGLLRISVKLALGAELMDTKISVASPSSLDHQETKKEKEKEKEKEPTQPYEDKNRVLHQFFASQNTFSIKGQESNRAMQNLSVGMDNAVLSVIRGAPIVITPEMPNSNLESIYNSERGRFLRDDLVRAYFSLDSSTQAQREYKEKLEKLHKICFNEEPLTMLDDFKTYLENLDLDKSNLPPKENLLSDLEYFFERAGCHTYNIQYYLAQLDFTIKETGNSNPLFDTISMYLYDKKSSDYRNDLAKAQINEPAQAQIVEDQPVVTTLNRIKTKLLTNKYQLALISKNEKVDKGVIEFECCPVGVIFRVAGLDSWVQLGTIRWNELPARFPQNDSDIMKDSERWLPELVNYISEKGYIKKLEPTTPSNEGKILAEIISLEKKYPLFKNDQPLQTVHYLMFYKLFSELSERKSSTPNYPEKMTDKLGKGLRFYKSEPTSDPLLKWAIFIFKDVVKNPEKITSMTQLLESVPDLYKPAGKEDKESATLKA